MSIGARFVGRRLTGQRWMVPSNLTRIVNGIHVPDGTECTFARSIRRETATHAHLALITTSSIAAAKTDASACRLVFDLAHLPEPRFSCRSRSSSLWQAARGI